jgi:hypothetical protein
MAQGLTQAQIIDRLDRLDRAVQQIAAHLGITLASPADGIDPDVVALARSGDRMRAAKLYAERTGCDFITAQRVVNDL